MAGRLRALVLWGCVLGASACSSDGPSPDAAPPAPADADVPDTESPYSVASELAAVPMPSTDGPSDPGASLITIDLDRASELAGLERPTDPADADGLTSWEAALGALHDEASAVYVTFLPSALRGETLDPADADEVAEALGWSLVDVRWFTETGTSLEPLALLTGDFQADEIDAAQGERVDGIWRLGDEVGVGESTPARPYGQLVRSALRGDRLAVGNDTEVVARWLDEGAATLADDEGLMALAEVLDDAGAYSSFLGRVRDYDGPYPPGAEPELEWFDAMAIGLGVEGGKAMITLAYHHATPTSAAASAASLDAVLRTGSNAVNGLPWSDFFVIEAIDVRGSTVVASLRPASPAGLRAQDSISDVTTLTTHRPR